MSIIKTSKRGKYTVETHEDGCIIWRCNGKIHRENGPAKIWTNGNKEWLINNKHHRTDGPACEYVLWTTKSKYWLLDGIEYTEKEWKEETRKRKLKALGI